MSAEDGWKNVAAGVAQWPEFKPQPLAVPPLPMQMNVEQHFAGTPKAWGGSGYNVVKKEGEGKYTKATSLLAG